MLLDPLKKQFNFPAALVDFRDGKCGKHKIVSQEFQSFVGLFIEIIDASQCIRIRRRGFERCQNDRLI